GRRVKRVVGSHAARDQIVSGDAQATFEHNVKIFAVIGFCEQSGLASNVHRSAYAPGGGIKGDEAISCDLGGSAGNAGVNLSRERIVCNVIGIKTNGLID